MGAPAPGRAMHAARRLQASRPRNGAGKAKPEPAWKRARRAQDKSSDTEGVSSDSDDRTSIEWWWGFAGCWVGPVVGNAGDGVQTFDSQDSR